MADAGITAVEVMTVQAQSVIQAVAAIFPDGSGGHVRRTIHGRNEHGHVVANIEEQRWVPSRPAAEV